MKWVIGIRRRILNDEKWGIVVWFVYRRVIMGVDRVEELNG